jgi:hypothetical protein
MTPLEQKRQRALEALVQPATPPAPSPASARAPAPSAPSRTLPRTVLVVVPHREREGQDSGRGFVVRTATVLADGSLLLPQPYEGVPAVQTFERANGAAADRLASQMSGLSPKKRIGRLVAARRVAEAFERDGWSVVLKPKRARPGQRYLLEARRKSDIGAVTISGDGSLDFWGDFDVRSTSARPLFDHVRRLVLYALKSDEPHPAADPKAKKIARQMAAEKIATALRNAGWEAEVSWDIEHPAYSVTVRATNGERVGFVTVWPDGSLYFEAALERPESARTFAEDLVDEALQGAAPDPALNPPAQRRAAIAAWEAAQELVRVLDEERDEWSWYTEARVDDRHPGHERAAVDVRGAPPPTVALEHTHPEHLGRVRFLDNGGVDYVGFSAEHTAHLRDAVARALDGRTIFPDPKGDSP